MAGQIQDWGSTYFNNWGGIQGDAGSVNETYDSYEARQAVSWYGYPSMSGNDGYREGQSIALSYGIIVGGINSAIHNGGYTTVNESSTTFTFKIYDSSGEITDISDWTNTMSNPTINQDPFGMWYQRDAFTPSNRIYRFKGNRNVEVEDYTLTTDDTNIAFIGRPAIDTGNNLFV